MAKLWYRYAAMNAGKSTSLMQAAHNYEERGMNVLVMKPGADTKGDNKIVSRINIERKVDVLIGETDSVYKLLEGKLEGIKAIFVDEAQFLSEKQVLELWKISIVDDIPILCYGLVADFKLDFFEGSSALMRLADQKVELTTICDCGKQARHNARIVNGEYVYEGEQVVIDGDAEYKSLCKSCYLEKVLKEQPPRLVLKK